MRSQAEVGHQGADASPVTGETSTEETLASEPAGAAVQAARDIRHVRWGFTVGVGASAAAIPAALGLLAGGTPGQTLAAAGVLFALSGATWASLWAMHRASARLARAADVESIGPLLQAMQGSVPLPPQGVRDALVRLLPQMQPDDFARLGPMDRHSLHEALTSDERVFRGKLWGSDLKVAVADALAQAGDGQSARCLELAAHRCRDPRVRAQAADALKRLLARLDAERPAALLLRPAEAPDSAVLLRPAKAAGGTRAEMLLRPAEEGAPCED